MTDLPPVERIQAVAVEPGDVVVVTLPRGAKHDEVARAREVIAASFPRHEVLVVTEGVELSVMRPGEDTG